MARCPFAVWRPLPENWTQPRIDPSVAIIHSAVDAPGPSSLFPFFARSDVKVETTFFIKNDGAIEQYMDTEVRADGNRWANGFAVSIETEDDGDPDQRPWTLAQIVSMRRLLEWLFRVHPKIKRRICPAWNAPGVGWHSMWGAPSPWTPTRGKTCPGLTRIPQFRREIVRWMVSGSSAPQLTTRPPRRPVRMFMVQSSKTGAVLLVTGSVSLLIVNTNELAAHKEAGIPVIRVGDDQFKRYERLRVA